jgi:hypothetical protein
MSIREIVLRALEGTPLDLIASFSLHAEDDGVSALMPRAKSVVVVGARRGVTAPAELERVLLHVDMALALARIGSRRIDPSAALLPRIFDACGVWLVDVDVGDAACDDDSGGLLRAG